MNCSATVVVEAPAATVVCVSTPVSPFTCGAPKNPASPPPAETDVSACDRMSISVSAYADDGLERRLCDSALIVWRNEVCTDTRSVDDFTRR